MPKNQAQGGDAYWLRGEQECPHCLRGYTFSVERRCSACDGPACPGCVTIVRATGETFCSACEQEELTRPDAEKGS